MTVQDKQSVYTLVVGLGKTGISVVRYLCDLGEAVVVTDSRDIPPGLGTLKQEFSDVQYYLGGFDAELFLHAHRIIVSPGISLATPVLQLAKNKGIEICGDIDLFSHEVSSPVVGVTGSNGKSTVTSLLTQMSVDAGYDAVAAGNIGVPVLDLLHHDMTDGVMADDESTEKKLYVLELSSFQLETLNNLPMKAAVVLNVSADHMDRYDDLNAYACSKQRIYETAEKHIVNIDDSLSQPVRGNAAGTIEFTLHEPAEHQLGVAVVGGERCLCKGKDVLIKVREVRLKGNHNLQNAMAALALGMAIDIPLASMLSTLRSFSGLPHRTQWLADIEGVSWINDSKATNVGAAIAAIKGLSCIETSGDVTIGKPVLIAGGEAKQADFHELAAVINKYCRAVILLGKDAAVIERSIQQLQPAATIPVKRVTDMKAAVYAAKEFAVAGDSVLLAPACASFDMFDSFEHRGDVFSEMVFRLSAELQADSQGTPSGDDQTEGLSS